MAGRFSPPEPCWDVAISGNRLYLNSGPSIVITDISQPTRPVYLASYQKATNSIAASGAYLYISAAAPFGGPNSLQVLDASDPEDVQLVMEQPQDRGGLKLIGQSLYCNTASAVHIFDVTQPRNPRPVWHVRLVASDLAASEELLYVAGRADGLTIVDTHNADSKVEA